MNNVYIDIHASVLKFVADTAGQLSTDFGQTVTPANLDAVAEAQDLPKGDFLGISGLEVKLDPEGLNTCNGVIICSTENDPNNMRLTKYVNALGNLLNGAQEFPFIREEDGTDAGTIATVGITRILPVERSAVRAAQGVSFSGRVVTFENAG